jgi:small subunit ribosomal protein S10
MNQKLKIKLLSYDHDLLDKSVRKIIEAVRASNCKIQGPIPLPTKKEIFTICRSVHVDKPSREQFERRTHKRLIVLTDITPQTMALLQRFALPPGVDIKIQMV